jgi:hypothetical protein
MKLTLKRIAKRDTYTIGKLYINGEYFCDTLEDKDRGLKQSMSLSEIKAKKVYGKTAIPAGEYEVTLHTISPKYSKKPWYVKFCGAKMPRILNIPGYDGVLMHPGNSDKDTCGCILVGKNTVVGKVLESRDTFAKLYPILKAASDKGERITINIK